LAVFADPDFAASGLNLVLQEWRTIVATNEKKKHDGYFMIDVFTIKKKREIPVRSTETVPYDIVLYPNIVALESASALGSFLPNKVE
jgi:hypothetical protein